jgi:hypothetical protein
LRFTDHGKQRFPMNQFDGFALYEALRIRREVADRYDLYGVSGVMGE